MISIDLGVIRSKVKVTMLFKHYLYEYAYDIYLMFSHIMHFFINDSSQLLKDIFLSIMFFTIKDSIAMLIIRQ